MHIDLVWAGFCTEFSLAACGWQGKPEGEGRSSLQKADYAILRKLETVVYVIESHRMVLTIGMKLSDLTFRNIFLAGIRRMMNQRGV